MNKKTLIFIFISALLFQFPAVYSSEETWKLLFQPRQRTVRTIGTFKEKMFIGTGNGVFVSKDDGKTWEDFGSEKLLKDEGGNSVINWISIDEEGEKIYIATSYGAYESKINEPSWKLIFDDIKTGTKDVNALLIHGENSYFCTNDGLWFCKETNTCKRLNEGLEPDSISGNILVNYSLKYNNDLYLATTNGIYYFNQNKLTWENISSGIKKLPDGRINAKHLLIENDNALWAASGTGIYLSSNLGQSCEDLSKGIGKNEEGYKQCYYLYKHQNNLYTACASGVYLFNRDKKLWENISDGIRTTNSSKNIYWLHSFKDNLYAATDEGLFVLYNNNSTISNEKIILKGKIETDFANLKELEPTVIEVQKKALEFASLPTSGDYKRYRLQARLRNIVPMIGFDLNSTGTSSDYYQFDKGITSDTSLNNDFNAGKTNRYQFDGRSFKQLSVLWNTNEFIYDDEIKEILNQARLTANIRENLLDDVTRIYFQRKKLQLENLAYKPENKNPSEKLIKELEISELTGQLDSRTGGWFSREIEKRKEGLLSKQ